MYDKIAIRKISILKFITFLFLCFTFCVNANQATSLEKAIVIKYDYSSEECLKASTANLHRISGNILYLKADTTLKLLGEKNEIIIPGIKECELLFSLKKEYASGDFFLYPTNVWASLDVAKAEIEEMRNILLPISKLAIKETSINPHELYEAYFDNNMGATINDYELEHYRVYLFLKKFHIPKEIYPRDKHYFRVYVKINKKK